MPQGYELLLLVGVVILLFGGSKLPKLARSLGQAKKEFESGTRESSEGDIDKPAKAEVKSDAPKAETTEKTDAAE